MQYYVRLAGVGADREPADILLPFPSEQRAFAYALEAWATYGARPGFTPKGIVWHEVEVRKGKFGPAKASWSGLFYAEV
jgi:hypothetical protein